MCPSIPNRHMFPRAPGATAHKRTLAACTQRSCVGVNGHCPVSTPFASSPQCTRPPTFAQTNRSNRLCRPDRRLPHHPSISTARERSLSTVSAAQQASLQLCRFHVKNVYGVDCVGRNAIDRGRVATKRSAAVDGEGAPSSLLLCTPANQSDMRTSCSRHSQLPLFPLRPERPLYTDKKYDSAANRHTCAARDRIFRRRTSNSRRTHVKRGVAERFFSCLTSSGGSSSGTVVRGRSSTFAKANACLAREEVRTRLPKQTVMPTTRSHRTRSRPNLRCASVKRKVDRAKW